MNRMLAMVMLLGSLTTLSARADEWRAGILKYQLANENRDGSQSFYGIYYTIGDQVFDLAYTTDNDYSTACKLLGFNNSLEGYKLNSFRASKGYKAILDYEGNYVNTSNEGINRVSKVTCYNSLIKENTLRYKTKENEDGTVTIKKISYTRGDRTFPVLAYFSETFDAICSAAGYHKAIVGKGLSVAKKASDTVKIAFSPSTNDYEYTDYVLGHEYKVVKVTCEK